MIINLRKDFSRCVCVHVWGSGASRVGGPLGLCPGFMFYSLKIGRVESILFSRR